MVKARGWLEVNRHRMPPWQYYAIEGSLYHDDPKKVVAHIMSHWAATWPKRHERGHRFRAQLGPRR